MNKANKISEAELAVMKILWDADQPVSTNTIYKHLQDQMGWDRSTVRTLIKRLHEKEAITQKKLDVYCYLPAISEAEYLNVQTKSFIERLYGGSVKNLVASLVQNSDLSPEDIEELKEFLKSGGNRHE
jgi:BlaI family penicillinase repressor